MKSFAIALLSLAAATNAIELTPDNWDANVAGKTVFIKFFAPWCGHCKAMKGDWDTLMGEYADSTTALVADVDCTAEGTPLCELNGVQGFPTLKWGDPSALEDYEGQRDYDSLKAFAVENLKPMCSPANIDLCDDEKKAEIERFLAMSEADLELAVDEKSDLIKKAEADFEHAVEGLQATYEKLIAEKDQTITGIKQSGLGLMKSVLAFKAHSNGGEL